MIRPLVEVFAVEDTAVQVSWRSLPGPDVSVEIGDRSVTPAAGLPAAFRRRRRRPLALSPSAGNRGNGRHGGPGAVRIAGLEPGTTYDITMSGPGVPRRVVGRITTLRPPPGRLLARFATISDMHIGERGFGVKQTIEDHYPLPAGWESYSLRCARAAIAEAAAWGAELLVVKGDLTRRAEPVEFDEVGRLLSSAPMPVEATFGNHEYHDVTDGRAILARHGLTVPRQPWARDLPGIRVVLADSARAGRDRGRLRADDERRLVTLAGEAPAAAMVVIHHQPQRWRLPNQYPPGIPGPEAARLLDALGEANPATIVVVGHTHRNRRHQHGPVVVAEVGSTHHYPGQWAGYAVYEGGLRQVVHRIAAPEAISWTDPTFWALGGIWGVWAAGSRSQRCFSHSWPARPR